MRLEPDRNSMSDGGGSFDRGSRGGGVGQVLVLVVAVGGLEEPLEVLQSIYKRRDRTLLNGMFF